MDFWQTILTSLITSGIVSSIVSYFLNKKFDIYKRTMEMRRREYIEISETLKGLYSTASPEEAEKTKKALPTYYRKLQAWASDEVLTKLVELIRALDRKSSSEQNLIDTKYKELIIAMRTDLLGKTQLKPEDIYIIGKIN